MLKQYLKNTSGNMAVLFGICATLIVAGVGAAIDVSGMTQVKSKLQNVTDAAVLAAAASGEQNITNLTEVVAYSIRENTQDNTKIDYYVNMTDDSLRVEATMPYPTKIMSVLGKSSVKVTTTSEAPLTRSIPMNISLVLDVSASMKGDKLIALKEAATTMVDVYEGFPGDVRMAVVPYANYVNVGDRNRHVCWMKVPYNYTHVGEEVCFDEKDILDPSQCVVEQVAETCYEDGEPYTCYRTDTKCPDSAHGPSYQSCYKPETQMVWNGCAGTREGAQSGNAGYFGAKVPGIMNVECGNEEILPITTNYSSIRKTINGLTADGETYMPTGLIWGWRTLEPDYPYIEPSNSEAGRKRIMVIMTDGHNTKSLVGQDHIGDNISLADSMTVDLCNSIKDSGIEIYTVGVNLKNQEARIKTLLRNCATSPTHFYDARDNDELVNAFEGIAVSMQSVRLIR